MSLEHTVILKQTFAEKNIHSQKKSITTYVKIRISNSNLYIEIGRYLNKDRFL